MHTGSTVSAVARRHTIRPAINKPTLVCFYGKADRTCISSRRPNLWVATRELPVPWARGVAALLAAGSRDKTMSSARLGLSLPGSERKRLRTKKSAPAAPVLY